jgi:hypothetical protein
MANTYTFIASSTVTTAVPTVTFNSIPQTYTDLLIKASARNTDTGGGSMETKFNNDTTALNYLAVRVLAAGSGNPTGNTYAGSAGAAFISSNDYTAGVFSATEIYIANYTSSTTYKVTSNDSASENNATASFISMSAGLYKINSAITSIQLGQGGSFDFVTGSTFYLYGIKNT